MLNGSPNLESPKLSESVVNALLPVSGVTVALSDNGASKDAGCCKTTEGSLPNSFRPDPKSVKVGDMRPRQPLRKLTQPNATN